VNEKQRYVIDLPSFLALNEKVATDYFFHIYLIAEISTFKEQLPISTF
jgi:hypothetical protein